MILLVIIILSLIHFPRHAHRRTKDQKDTLEAEEQAREDSPASKRQIPKRRTSQVWHVQY